MRRLNIVVLQSCTTASLMRTTVRKHMATCSSKSSYNAAIEKLNTLQTSYEILDRRRQIGKPVYKNGQEETKQWLKRLGYSVLKLADLDRLNVIHIAGTKGKGSTCAFIDSILREYRKSLSYPTKVGMYTSPHVMSVRERVQINSKPVSEELFTKSFSKIWDAVSSTDDKKPGYFHFLTLMSIDIFLEEKVDVAIYETGVGGEEDATNIFQHPISTGITSLAIDHPRLKVAPQMRPHYFSLDIGDGEDSTTIEEIAWHKSGIFKTGSPAFSVNQQPLAEKVLEYRATEKCVSLTFVDPYPELSAMSFPAKVFESNASLAVAMSNHFLDRCNVQRQHKVTAPIIKGLKQARLLGRCQVLKDDLCEWYVDGAHTKESLAVAAEWFAKNIKRDEPGSSHQRTVAFVPLILIFNQQNRNGEVLLPSLFHALQSNGLRISHAIFCTNFISAAEPERCEFVNRNKDPTATMLLHQQQRYRAVWENFDSTCQVITASSVEAAVHEARMIGKEGMKTLVTGSLHLVGSFLYFLDPSSGKYSA